VFKRWVLRTVSVDLRALVNIHKIKIGHIFGPG